LHSRTTSQSQPVAIQLTNGEKLEHIYDSCANDFVRLKETTNIEVLARYVGSNADGEVAAVKCVFGKGKAILMCPNLEFPITELSTSSLTPEIIAHAEEKRHKFLRATVEDLGLHLSSDEERWINHPLPQFLVSYKAQPTAVYRIIQALATSSPASQLSVFEDRNDVFHFHPLAQSSYIVDESRSTSTTVSSQVSAQ